MNGELARVSCELESVTCSTETAAGATKVTLGQRLRRAWAESWKRPARMWANSIDAIQRMIRVCYITPMACNFRR
jgi:hypothetical protein